VILGGAPMRAGGSGIRAGSTTRWPRHDPRSERGDRLCEPQASTATSNAYEIARDTAETAGRVDFIGIKHWSVSRSGDPAVQHLCHDILLGLSVRIGIM
jgi:hypothetical protein